ncbi:MAG TPA: hypothetical protein V6D03_16190 [Candidatus Caenarcaniphilales bacterium]
MPTPSAGNLTGGNIKGEEDWGLGKERKFYAMPVVAPCDRSLLAPTLCA